MHWALHVKDDRYGEDLPNANAQEVGTLEDDESGDNSFLLHVQKILKDVDRKFEPAQPTTAAKLFGKPVPRTSFLHPTAINKMTSSAKIISVSGDDTMPVMNAENLRFDVSDVTEDDDQQDNWGGLVVALSASHGDPKDSIGSTDFAAPSTLLTT
jgi:hypothetical protein